MNAVFMYRSQSRLPPAMERTVELARSIGIEDSAGGSIADLRQPVFKEIPASADQFSDRQQEQLWFSGHIVRTTEVFRAQLPGEMAGTSGGQNGSAHGGGGCSENLADLTRGSRSAARPSSTARTCSIQRGGSVRDVLLCITVYNKTANFYRRLWCALHK
jgi:hypothetical protein